MTAQQTKISQSASQTGYTCWNRPIKEEEPLRSELFTRTESTRMNGRRAFGCRSFVNHDGSGASSALCPKLWHPWHETLSLKFGGRIIGKWPPANTDEVGLCYCEAPKKPRPSSQTVSFQSRNMPESLQSHSVASMPREVTRL